MTGSENIEADKVLNAMTERALQSVMPRLRVMPLQGFGHNAPDTEAPGAVAEIFTDFFA